MKERVEGLFDRRLVAALVAGQQPLTNERPDLRPVQRNRDAAQTLPAAGAKKTHAHGRGGRNRLFLHASTISHEKKN